MPNDRPPMNGMLEYLIVVAMLAFTPVVLAVIVLESPQKGGRRQEAMRQDQIPVVDSRRMVEAWTKIDKVGSLHRPTSRNAVPPKRSLDRRCGPVFAEAPRWR